MSVSKNKDRRWVTLPKYKWEFIEHLAAKGFKTNSRAIEFCIDATAEQIDAAYKKIDEKSKK